MVGDKDIGCALIEDQEDLAAFEERASEPTISYEALLEELRAHGVVLRS